jgi:hypothetical protein
MPSVRQGSCRGAYEGRAEIGRVEVVNGEFFSTLGGVPRLGRLLQPGDERMAARVVVLRESFWRARFHGDESAIGRTMSIAGQPFEVVGVVRADFRGSGDDPLILPAAWIVAGSLATDEAGRELAARGIRSSCSPSFWSCSSPAPISQTWRWRAASGGPRNSSCVQRSVRRAPD